MASGRARAWEPAPTTAPSLAPPPKGLRAGSGWEQKKQELSVPQVVTLVIGLYIEGVALMVEAEAEVKADAEAEAEAVGG